MSKPFLLYKDHWVRFLKPLQREVGQEWLSLVDSGNFRKKYTSYLIQTYHYVKYSTKLMGLACSRLDHQYSMIISYLAKHIGEEAGHDGWILSDLNRLGYGSNFVRSIFPLRETISMVSNQFYLINETHPLALLGYIYALESQPWSVGYLSALCSQQNIPFEAMSTLIKHAENDPYHIRDLHDLLDSACIQPETSELISYNAMMTLESLSELVRAVHDMDHDYLDRPLREEKGTS